MEGKIKKNGSWYTWKVKNDYGPVKKGFWATITMTIFGADLYGGEDTHKVNWQSSGDERKDFRTIAHSILDEK
jgi:hypothetical protein